MKWLPQLSDEQYVERVQRNAQFRRKIASVGLAIAMLSGGLCVGLFLHVLQTGVWRIHDDSDEQLAFQIGLINGFVGGIIVFSAVQWIALAIYLFFPVRKDKLLLQYHRRLSELNQLPLSPANAD